MWPFFRAVPRYDNRDLGPFTIQAANSVRSSLKQIAPSPSAFKNIRFNVTIKNEGHALAVYGIATGCINSRIGLPVTMPLDRPKPTTLLEPDRTGESFPECIASLPQAFFDALPTAADTVNDVTPTKQTIFIYGKIAYEALPMCLSVSRVSVFRDEVRRILRNVLR
jgi:hypothetical protein